MVPVSIRVFSSHTLKESIAIIKLFQEEEMLANEIVMLFVGLEFEK